MSTQLTVESSPHSERQPPTVLIVDDDDDLAETLCELLSREGYRVVRCADGQTGLEFLAHEGAPDLILLDLVMPGMDGWEFRARQLRDPKLAHVPVVALSADTSSKARVMDAAAYLVKPIDAPSLLNTISHLASSQARQRAQALALERERLSSLGSLASSIAHEINNPLQFVVGNLELARMRLRRGGAASLSAEELDGLLDAVQRGVSRITDVVRSMAAFSRPETQAAHRIDVPQALESTIQLLANAIRHRASLERDYAPTPEISGNLARFGQALLNLLIHAIQAVGEGAAQERVIRVATQTADSGDAVITISDNGAGMTHRLAAGIFDLSYASRHLSPEQVRGLSISHGIIREMGGSISVESTPNRGSVFRVSLPGLPGSPGPLERGVSLSRPEPGSRPKLLVVDDEPLVCALLTSILEDAYHVEALTSPREAMARLLSGESFDLILCDLMMPDLTGMDLHEALERALPEQARRMVFMTGGTFTERSQRFIEKVEGVILTKPFRRDDVIAALARRLASLSQSLSLH